MAYYLLSQQLMYAFCTLRCWDNVVLSAYGIWSFSAGDSSAKVAMMNAFINQADYAVFQIVFRYAGYCFFGG